MLKNFDNVKSIIEKDEAKASELDASKKSPLHAAAQNGTREIAGMKLNRLYVQIVQKWPKKAQKRTKKALKLIFFPVGC